MIKGTNKKNAADKSEPPPNDCSSVENRRPGVRFYPNLTTSFSLLIGCFRLEIGPPRRNSPLQSDLRGITPNNWNWSRRSLGLDYIAFDVSVWRPEWWCLGLEVFAEARMLEKDWRWVRAKPRRWKKQWNNTYWWHVAGNGERKRWRWQDGIFGLHTTCNI